MGLNLSTQQIAHELGWNKDDVQRMTEQLRDGVVARQPEPGLSGEVECDEVSVVAGHKGHPEAVKKRPYRAAATAERNPGAGDLRKGKAPDSRAVSAGG